MRNRPLPVYVALQVWLSLQIVYHWLIYASTCHELRERRADGILVEGSLSIQAYEAEARDRKRKVRELMARMLLLRGEREPASNGLDFWPAVGFVLGFGPGIAMLVGLWFWLFGSAP